MIDDTPAEHQLLLLAFANPKFAWFSQSSTSPNAVECRLLRVRMIHKTIVTNHTMPTA